MNDPVLRDASCIDLFCGAGGLTRGLSQAGLPVVAGIDLDPACRYPYEINNDVPFEARDVSDLTGDDLHTWFRPGSVTVLAGCAPCQPFSTYSQRYDKRSNSDWGLLYAFEKLIEQAVPDIVTMENVPSVERHEVFSDFVGGLEDMGYQVSYKVVNCADYGVPQSRNRMVLLASRFGPIEMIEQLLVADEHKTVRDVIAKLPPIAAGAPARDDVMHVSSRLSDKNLARIRASKPGGTWRDWPRELVADCHKADTGKTFPAVYGRMEWDKPAPTITTQCYGFGNGRFGHPDQDRAISLREAAVLQGFPQDYLFSPPDQAVPFKSTGRLIGNAVPVDLGRAIGDSIVRHLHEHGMTTRRPGDPNSTRHLPTDSRPGEH